MGFNHRDSWCLSSLTLYNRDSCGGNVHLGLKGFAADVPPTFLPLIVQPLGEPITRLSGNIVTQHVHQSVGLGFSTRPKPQVCINEMHPRVGILNKLENRVREQKIEGGATPEVCENSACEV